MKDLEEVSYVLGIQILRDRPSDIMRLSQHTYIESILKRFNMQSYSSGKTPIIKGDRFFKSQCSQNDIESDQIKAVPYSLVLDSMMYAQVCTHLDIVFFCWLVG